MNTPVLFLIFNRPDYTKQVFEAIRKARPNKLFIAADGPRATHRDDPSLCKKAREIIQNVDWPCEVKTLFREKNLGCKRAVSGGINWFFENIEEGIILEDDCLPNQSFFRFAEMMLERYRHDSKVGTICGMNTLPLSELEKIDSEAKNYYFVRPMFIWGWATWRRAWSNYDLSMKEWPKWQKNNQLKIIFQNRFAPGYYGDLFQMAYDGRANTWDIQWFFSSLLAGFLSIIPPRNLVRNIGIQGSHTEKESFINRLPTDEIDLSHLIGLRRPELDQDIEEKLMIISGSAVFSLRRYLIKFLEIIGLKKLVRWFYRRFMLNF